MIKVFNDKNFFIFTLLIMVFTFAFTTGKILATPAGCDYGYFFGVRLRPNVISNHILSIFCLITPVIIIKLRKLKITPGSLTAYTLFIFLSTYFGSTLDGYFVIPQWDKVMHAYGGILLAALGFMLIKYVHKKMDIPTAFSPLIAAVVAFCFATTASVIWEIYEFLVDLLIGTNMQRHSTICGEPLVGQAALWDTMVDLIANAIGALSVSVVGYVSLKRDGQLIDKLYIEKISE